MVRLAVLAALLTALPAMGGCGHSAEGYRSDGVVSGPLLTSVGTSEDGMMAEVKGRVSYDDGCLRLRGMPAIWPEGTTWDASSRVLTLPEGEGVPLGGRVSGGGGYLHPRAVAQLFGADVAAAARPCLGPTREIAVFNPGWDVSSVG
jgi:hypothetical protein